MPRGIPNSKKTAAKNRSKGQLRRRARERNGGDHIASLEERLVASDAAAVGPAQHYAGVHTQDAAAANVIGRVEAVLRAYNTVTDAHLDIDDAQLLFRLYDAMKP